MKHFITGVILTTWVISLGVNYVFISGKLTRQSDVAMVSPPTTAKAELAELFPAYKTGK